MKNSLPGRGKVLEIYLIQHAKAKPREVDPEQPLTGEGAESFRKVAEHVARLNIDLGKIYHSGKLRAAQTAEILAERTGKTGDLQARPGMEPTDDVKPTAEWLHEQQAKGVAAVTIVGHLPFLDKLTSLLTSGNEDAGVVSFHNGGVVKLKSKSLRRGFSVEGIITPEILT